MYRLVTHPGRSAGAGVVFTRNFYGSSPGDAFAYSDGALTPIGIQLPSEFDGYPVSPGATIHDTDSAGSFLMLGGAEFHPRLRNIPIVTTPTETFVPKFPAGYPPPGPPFFELVGCKPLGMTSTGDYLIVIGGGVQRYRGGDRNAVPELMIAGGEFAEVSDVNDSLAVCGAYNGAAVWQNGVRAIIRPMSAENLPIGLFINNKGHVIGVDRRRDGVRLLETKLWLYRPETGALEIKLPYEPFQIAVLSFNNNDKGVVVLRRNEFSGPIDYLLLENDSLRSVKDSFPGYDPALVGDPYGLNDDDHLQLNYDGQLAFGIPIK